MIKINARSIFLQVYENMKLECRADRLGLQIYFLCCLVKTVCEKLALTKLVVLSITEDLEQTSQAGAWNNRRA